MSKLICKQPSPFTKDVSKDSLSSFNQNKIIENDFFGGSQDFFDNFKNSLTKSGIADDSVERLSDKINKISQKIDNTNKNILVVGSIQSGKTNSFLGLISKVFDDNKVNLSFILGGVDTEICEQNTSRVKSLFDDPYIKSKIAIFESNDYKDPNKIRELKISLENNKKVIIVSIKNWVVINKWKEALENFVHLIYGTIIIDDEGDQFSLNDWRKAINEERTATNKSINELITLLVNKVTFVSVTATPYAQIISNSQDSLKPDYAFLIDRGVGYTPLSYFLAQDGINRDDVTNIIPDDEIIEFKEQGALGSSFRDAIFTHIVHSILFFRWVKNKNIKDKIPKMLINPGSRIDEHNNLENLLRMEYSFIKRDIESNNQDSRQFISKILSSFNNYLKNSKDKYSDAIKLDDLIMAINSKMMENQLDIILVNGENQFRNSNKIFTFYIGCNKLSRGITIPSLITTYYFTNPNSKPSADTISQAARWLGYRNNYIYFLTIYLSKNLIEHYDNVSYMTDEIFQLLSEYEKENASIKNLARRLYLKNGERLTRATRETVSKQIFKRDNNTELRSIEHYRGFFLDSKYEIKNAIHISNSKSNERLVHDIILKNYNKSKLMTEQFNSNKLRNCPYIIYPNIESFKRSITLEVYNDIPERLDISRELFSKIIEKNKDKKVIFSLVQGKFEDDIIYYNRSYFGKKVSEIAVGSQDKYIGDKYWLDEIRDDNFLVFQIYAVKLKDEEKTNSKLFKMALMQKTDHNFKLSNETPIVVEGIT